MSPVLVDAKDGIIAGHARVRAAQLLGISDIPTVRVDHLSPVQIRVGADVIIIDDPVKAADAISDTRRDSLNEWFDNTLRSRLNSQEKGAVIIVMQRLHADDLVAHVQENEQWDVVSLPAIAVEDTNYNIVTPYGRRKMRRQEGEILQPALLPPATLEKLRQAMSEHHFAAQYQQNPTPRGGNMIKTEWLEYYEPGKEPGKFDRIFQSWDTANKAGELNDFSVCTTWGVHKRTHYYLLDVFRKKLSYPDLKYAVIQQQKRYPNSVIVIEDNASGTPLIQDLKREGKMLIRPYSPPAGTDKELRVDAQSIHFENHRVFLRRPAPWLREYVAELTGFPNMRFDDQVDSTVQFLDYVNKAGAFPMVFSKEVMDRSKIPGPWGRRRY